jgi:precorrin-4/cobalt-precorrin-4 C11-methyltransferase
VSGARGKVVFVGAGPGAADLLTVRGARAIAAADVVLWASSLVMEEVLEHAADGAEILDSSSLTLEDQRDVYERAAREGLRVARVQSGDPSIYSAVGEQIEVVEEIGLEYEMVPGVSSLSAAAAALGQELTTPERAQSLIVSRREGRSPMPPGERLEAFARHGTTMALFLSIGRPDELQDELLAGGYTPDAPFAVVYRASWPDERVVRGPLGELAQRVREAGINRQALVLVGPGLGAGGTRSHLYDPRHGHRFREAVGRCR